MWGGRILFTSDTIFTRTYLRQPLQNVITESSGPGSTKYVEEGSRTTMLARCAPMPYSRPFVLLSPAKGGTPAAFAAVSGDADEYSRRLREMQRLRGSIYLREGAISEGELTADGRHELAGDENAWHLLLLGEGKRIVGCMRYLLHRNAIAVSKLSASSCALGLSPEWGGHLEEALRRELALAQEEKVGFAEIGGWALAEQLRTSTEGIRIVLATYALGRLLGNAIGISTATTRNGSSKILRRLGGQSVEAGNIQLPTYFDPHYKCDMELLRFDSRAPNARYAEWVDYLHSELVNARVICATRDQFARKIFFLGSVGDVEQRI